MSANVKTEQVIYPKISSGIVPRTGTRPLARVENYFNSTPPPTRNEITEAFWQACHGGQRITAEYLLARGAKLNWIPPWSPQTPFEHGPGLHADGPPAEDLVEWLRAKGARPPAILAYERSGAVREPFVSFADDKRASGRNLMMRDLVSHSDLCKYLKFCQNENR